MKNLIIIFLVIIVLLNGCGSEQSKPSIEQPEKVTSQETIPPLNWEKVISNLKIIYNSDNSKFISDSLKDTYYYLSQDYLKMYELAEKVKKDATQKEGFCSIISEKIKDAEEIQSIAKENSLKSTTLLFTELNKFEGNMVNKVNGNLKALNFAKEYCEEGSVLGLTKASQEFFMLDAYFKARHTEPKAEYDLSFGTTTAMYSTDQTIYKLIKEIDSKISLSKETETTETETIQEYGIGDTITKGGRSVTLKKVEKGYIDPRFSFEEDCGTWTNQEQLKMFEFQMEIYSPSNEAIKDQLIQEYYTKYLDKLTNPCCKYWFFDFGTYKGNTVTIYDTDKEEILMIGGQAGVPRQDKAYYSQGYSGFAPVLYSECEKIGLGGMKKIKIVLSSDNCGDTKENILGVEKGLIKCDETFVFNVDLSKF